MNQQVTDFLEAHRVELEQTLADYDRHIESYWNDLIGDIAGKHGVDDDVVEAALDKIV